VSVRDLFRATLRMRPDRIVVGEIRGGEALDLIQAMTSGHGGCLSTLHATYPRDTLTRLETMAMMSDIDMPLAALRIQLASAVNMIVQVARLQDGSRKLTHVTEVLSFDPATAQYVTQDIFERKFVGLDDQGNVQSELVATGILPRALPQLHEHGTDMPEAVYQAAERREANGGGSEKGHG
jgi:pilus assembly protein CpaF